MSARQYREARRKAYAEAERTHLWKKGEEEVKKKWYRKILWYIWKPFKKFWQGRIARWYRSNLKRWSHEIVARKHDPDVIELKRIQRKLEKKRTNLKLPMKRSLS